MTNVLKDPLRSRLTYQLIHQIFIVLCNVDSKEQGYKTKLKHSSSYFKDVLHTSTSYIRRLHNTKQQNWSKGPGMKFILNHDNIKH